MGIDGGDGDDTYIIDNNSFSIIDSGGNDTAQVSISFVKIPSSIENIVYTNGAVALPYWLDSLLDDEAASFSSFVNDTRIFYRVYPRNQRGWTG